MLENIIIEIIKPFIKLFFNLPKGKRNLQEDLESYFGSYYDKHSKIKTLLHGDKQLAFHDIYYPLNALQVGECSKQVRLASIEDLFEEKIPSCITIIGDAGSGKSTFVKNLFMQAIYRKKVIPLFIELRRIGAEQTIKEFIASELLSRADIFDVLEKQFKKGKIIFFLDGYDELKNKNKAELLSKFVDKYYKNKFILTSRPSSGANYLDRFENFKLQSLNRDDVKKFSEKQLNYMDGGDELKEGLLQSLEDGLRNNAIASFLTNPLLLSIYIFTYKNSPDIPKTKALFYRRVFEALFFKHDANTKPGYKREKQTKMDQNDFEKFLERFSFATYWQQEYEWQKKELKKRINKTKETCGLDFNTDGFIHDMVASIALWTEDDGTYAFSHRSFQEYFACYFIKEHSDKQKIYGKILSNLLSGNKVREIANLSDLLKDIDTETYQKHFYLPLLEKLKDDALYKDVESFIQHYILFIYSLGAAEQLAAKITQKHRPEIADIPREVDIGVEIAVGIGQRIGREIGMQLQLQIETEIEITRERELERELERERREELGRELGRELVREIGREIGREVGREIKDTPISQNLNALLFSYRYFGTSYLCFGTKGTLDNISSFIEEVPNGIRTMISSLINVSRDQKTIQSFIEEKATEKQVILYEDIPKNIIKIWKDAIRQQYDDTNSFLEHTIKELEEDTTTKDKKNKDDMDML